MIKAKYQSSILVFILLFFVNTNLFAYQSTNKKSIDSVVMICKQNLGFIDNTTEKLISIYLENKNSIKAFTPVEHLTVIVELKSNNDTIFTKEFYSVSNELIFLNEKHIIYNPEKIIDSLREKNFIVGYEADYYVIDNFYADGKMTYSYEFSGYDYGPEPLSYILKMIKQNQEYINSK